MTDLTEMLTDRESDILNGIVAGLSNQEIADRLHLALTTVKWYNTQIYEKLGVSNRDEATERAYELQLVDLTTADRALNQGHDRLPLQSTLFIGRSTELNEVASLVNHPATRILTILATGGMGKTRLALEVARRLLPMYDGNVYFVPLASVSAAEYLLSAIAEGTNAPIQSEARDPKAILMDYLARQHTLLVLDNIEHLLDGAPLISEIVQAAPEVKVLVTSREKLNLHGETVYALSGLDFPTWETPEDALNHDAVRLFMQSAQRIRPDFELQPKDLDYLARICRLIQGMPLAIELAAGWVDVLSLEQIAAEIQQGIDVLETELRDVPERHRSIRATLDYSWSGLQPAEQETFMKLSVFRGGFNTEAAQQVAGADLRTLRKLVNKALIYARADGRYEIHDLLRQYSEEKLAASGQSEAVHTAHGEYFTTLMEAQMIPMMDSSRIAFDVMETDYDNCLAAWEYVSQQLAYEGINRALYSLWFFFTSTGRHYDGVEIFGTTLKHLVRAPKTAEWLELYGRTLTQQSELYMAFAPQRGAKLAFESIDLQETLAPSTGLVDAYLLPGAYFFATGLQDEEAIEYLHKGFILAEQLGDKMRMILCKTQEVWLRLHSADLEKARQASEVAQNLAQKLDLLAFVRRSMLTQQGDIAWESGDYDKARRYYLEGLQLSTQARHLFEMSWQLGRLGAYALMQGNQAEAAAHTYYYLKAHQRYGRDWQILGALTGIVRHYLNQVGEYKRGAEILSFVVSHPQTAENARRNAHFAMVDDGLQAHLDKADLTAAEERSKSLRLHPLVNALLEEFAQIAGDELYDAM